MVRALRPSDVQLRLRPQHLEQALDDFVARRKDEEPDERLMRHLLDKAAAAGCGTVVLTIDSATRGNREAERWFARGGGRPDFAQAGGREPDKLPAALAELLRENEAAWFAPFHEFRFPRYGTINVDDIELELRFAIEPWHVLGEEVTAQGTARFVAQAKLQQHVDIGQLDQVARRAGERTSRLSRPRTTS